MHSSISTGSYCTLFPNYLHVDVLQCSCPAPACTFAITFSRVFPAYCSVRSICQHVWKHGHEQDARARRHNRPHPLGSGCPVGWGPPWAQLRPQHGLHYPFTASNVSTRYFETTRSWAALAVAQCAVHVVIIRLIMCTPYTGCDQAHMADDVNTIHCF